MKVIDCFPFYNELDILEIRLGELYDQIDGLVLVEAFQNLQFVLRDIFLI
jgi:beta-1,4-mannosyl-glycoprotein beta-1,4-N-acetylglucosaminyltransferase